MTRSTAGSYIFGATSIVVVLLVGACRADDDFEPGGTANLSTVDAAEYFELLNGDIALDVEGAPQPTIRTAEEWTNLVARQREVGLSGLTETERSDLLLVAVKAYLTFVGTAAFEYESPYGTATAAEAYAAGEAGLLLHLRSRQALYDGMEVTFGGLPFAHEPGVTEERWFLDVPTGDLVTGELWRRDELGWSCNDHGSDDGYNWMQSIRLIRLASLAEASPAGEGRINGRPVEVVTIASPDSVDSTYWLDAQTLWPIGWQEANLLPDGSDVMLRSELTVINEPLSIDPPESDCAAARPN